ncbi:LysM peptidoglycan-binding domain-containing protein, partial [Frateuria sp.]|uniref:LysM peptidoglycan-binding domain-containing protein n=1 Tax=Frateuria sp. TaxID=2211372 RepID=UPI003F7F9E5C
MDLVALSTARSVKSPCRLGMLVGMKKWMRFAAACTAAVLLAACGRSVVVQPHRGVSAPRQSVTVPRPATGSYRVLRGDTLYSIAFRHGLDFRDLAAWNGISSPYTIWPGQMLRLSPAQGRHAGARRPVASAAHPASPVFKPVAPAPSRPAPVVPSPTPAPAPVAATPAPPAVPAPRGATRTTGGVNWRWPADGTLIKKFQSGDAIPGIELAGKTGDPVRAAADGVVVYSGNGLVGYGELIIIKHNDDFLSA